MSIREWIRELEIGGTPTFSFSTVRRFFPNITEQSIKNDLFRLSTQKIIVPVYRGFYVIMPPQYNRAYPNKTSVGQCIIPPIYYIDQLMSYLDKPYYISLLNAAELLGSAHQRPQRFSVTTILPKSSVSPTKNNLLVWNYRNKMPSEFLLTRNSETGTIYYSNAELTAVDLVQYEQHIGGLSRAATILEELSELIDFSKISESLFAYSSLAAIQRLGFILDVVLQEEQRANDLYDLLCKYTRTFKYVFLSTRHSADVQEKNTRWKIKINTNIEVDDI